MTGPALAAIFYVSRSLTTAQQVERIVAASRKNNGQREITGALLWTGRYFVQVLEGALPRILAAYRMISNDERHSHLLLLSQSRIEGRSFGEWDMALVEDPEADALIEPFIDNRQDADAFRNLRDRLSALVKIQGNSLWNKIDSQACRTVSKIIRQAFSFSPDIQHIPVDDQIFSVLYVSRALASSAEISDMLAASRANNSNRKLTGSLLYTGYCFAQLLEGPGEQIARTMQRIEDDSRHSQVTRIPLLPYAHRRFVGWDMCFLSTPMCNRLVQLLMDKPQDPAAERLSETLISVMERGRREQVFQH